MKIAHLAACQALAFAFLACSSSESSQAPLGASPSSSTANWSCVGASTTLATPPKEEIDFTGTFVLAVTRRALSGMSIRACAREDEACAMPLAAAVADDEGGVRLHWETSGEVFLMVTARDVPTNLFFLPRGTRTYAGLVFDASAVRLAATLAQAHQDDDRGLVLVEARDCAGVAAPGVVFAIDDRSHRMSVAFVEDDQPLPTGHLETGPSGAAALFDVPAGHFELWAARRVPGKVVATASAFVPAGAVASLVVLPK